MITHQYIPESGQLISSQAEKHGDKIRHAMVVASDVTEDTKYAVMAANEKRLKARLRKEAA